MFESTDLKTHGYQSAANFKEGNRNMKTIILLRLLASVVVGIVITLISGLIQTPMGRLGVDVVYWGISLPWTMRVIPTHFQSIDWVNFLADSAFWVVIVAIVSAGLMFLEKRRPLVHQASTISTQ